LRARFSLKLPREPAGGLKANALAGIEPLDKSYLPPADRNGVRPLGKDVFFQAEPIKAAGFYRKILPFCPFIGLMGAAIPCIKRFGIIIKKYAALSVRWSCSADL
jgi:hypothetical protein